MKKGITLLCSALLLCGMSAVIGNAQDAAKETPETPAVEQTQPATETPAVEQAQPATEAEKAQPAEQAQAAKDPQTVLAKVNGEDILQQNVDKMMNMFVLPQFKQQNPDKEMSVEDRQQAEKNVLDRLVTQTVLLQAATKLNLTPDAEELAKRVEQMKTQQSNISEEDWKMLVTNEMLIQQVIQQEVVAKVTVADEEIQKFYDEQKDRFREPEQVRASHILIGVAQDAKPEEKEAAKKKADDVLAQVKEGKDFAELAKANSTCPSKEQGGDLGFFPRGAMVKPFEDAAFAMQEGQTSDIVETQFGYHIIKLTEKKAERTVPFEEVKDRLKQGLTQQKTNTAVMAWVDEQKKQANIEMMNQ